MALAGQVVWPIDYQIVLLAVVTGLALSVDSFCASAVDGARGLKGKTTKVMVVFLALVFASFHFLMPTVGYYVGQPFRVFLESYAKWITFGILVFLGVKGIGEQLLDLHVARMENLSNSVGFDGESYILKMGSQGLGAWKIKRRLAYESWRLKRKDRELIDRLCEGNVDKANGVSIYLGHQAKSLTPQKLKDLRNPDQDRTGREERRFFGNVAIQAFATSLDALAIGFSYSTTYDDASALTCFAIIGTVVFAMSLCGGFLGKMVGSRLRFWSNILGSLVLVGLGVSALF